MERGKLIVFEGLNGCGKGAQIANLTEHIYDSSRANTVFRTREPNEFDENGKMARKLLKSDGNPYENGLAAVGYFAKNRLTHCDIIGYMQEMGIDSVSDRFYYSNLVYQHIQGIPLEEIAKANEKAIRPDLTYILNVAPEEALRRLNGREHTKGRKFDSDLEFNSKVMDMYLKLGDVLPDLMNDDSIVYINGMQSIENVWKDVKNVYDERFL